MGWILNCNCISQFDSNETAQCPPSFRPATDLGIKRAVISALGFSVTFLGRASVLLTPVVVAPRAVVVRPAALATGGSIPGCSLAARE